jgi:hypothetical protein
MACIFASPNVHPKNGCMTVWPRIKHSSTLVETGGRESRYAYLMGTPSEVKQCSPNVLPITIRDSPNVIMGEQESRRSTT